MSNFLKSLFGAKKAAKVTKSKMQTRRLELIGLEERITPAATITNVNGILTISLAAGDSITNLNAAYPTSATLVINTVGNANLTSSLPTGVVVTSSSGTLNDIITVTASTFTNTILGISVVGSTGNESVTIGGAINLLTNAPTATNSLSIGTNLETLAVNAAITTLGATAGISGASLAATAVNIGAGGIINTTAGNVGITGVISTAGNVITTTGLTTYTGAVTLTGNVAIGNGSTSTGGVNFTSTVNGLFGITTTASGAAPVTFGGIVGTSSAPVGALAIASTGAISFGAAVNATSIAQTLAGTVTLNGAVNATNAIAFAGTVDGLNTSSVISVTSSTDNVTFSSTVGATAANANGVTVSAAASGKAISLGGNVSAASNSSIVFTGDVSITKTASALVVTSLGNGNITFNNKVDASVSGNDLTLTAGSGAVTIVGKVGSANANFGTLTASGTGTFLASAEITAFGVDLDETNDFATSITFAKAVAVSGVLSTDGVDVSAGGAGTITFSEGITVSGAAATSLAQIQLTSVSGAINVLGAITGLDLIDIESTSGPITLSGVITTSGTNLGVGAFNGLIFIGTNTAGNVLLSGATISTTGLGNIELDNDGTGSLTIGANVTTSSGDIFIGADTGSSATGGPSVTINGTVITTGTAAGDIFIGVSGGSVAVNKAITAGLTGDVVFITTVATDAITVASGATITAGDAVADFGAGILNLGANITAGTASIAGLGIILDNASTNLTAAVSLKTIGTTDDINLAKVNGAQNLTLETSGVAGSNIVLTSVGQTTPLNTVTVTNSGGVTAGSFTAKSVVLTDTLTGTAIAFGSIGTANTVITTGLTTAVKPYNVTFAGNTVLSGTPVFSNTGNVSFSGSTSLSAGATITGTAATTVNLAGTIVSAGAFNIGALPATTTIASGTSLFLNSTTAASIFDGKVVLNSGDTVTLGGLGQLKLTFDSTATVLGSINVINGTLNVTGKISAASISTATNGTISGAGGTIGVLNVNTGTVAPGGTLKTDIVNLNAATSYNVAVLTSGATPTGSNLETAAAINLGNAVLNLTSVASGLVVGDKITIINNTSASAAINGTFAGLAEGATVSGAKDAAGRTITYTISYKGGTGGVNANDAVLTVKSVTTATPVAAPNAQPMVAGQPALNKFTAIGTDQGGGPLVTITFADGTFTSFFAYAESFRGGVRVALGNVDGGTDIELITGAGPGGAPQVNVYKVTSSGVTLQKSFFAFNEPLFRGGIYVAAGDTNADTFADVVVGAGATGGSRVAVYAGSATGVNSSAPINDFFAYSPAFTGGVVVAVGERNGAAGKEVITAPASNGGFNIRSYDVNGKGNSPTLVDNFFAFNDITSVGGLSIAAGLLDVDGIADIVVGTTLGGFGVIRDSDTSGLITVPFPAFAGAIRAGVAVDSNAKEFAVALAGPTGGPRVVVYSATSTSLTEVDNLFVLNPLFRGGLFGSSSL